MGVLSIQASGTLESSSTTAGITASTTQSQGQGLLGSKFNEVSVCANANDVVTLPAAYAGCEVNIINNGAQTLQVYPSSGDAIDSGAVDASVTQSTGSNVRYVAHNDTTWNRFQATL